ncbi:MAG: succinate--CoA ligase subunit alpha [Candidatus Dormibacteraceae bacterium]
MTILAGASTRVIVQGITGRQASWCAQDIIAYGTRVVAGVVPGRGGGHHLDLPVFDFVADAVAATGADASLVFVPATVAGEAVAEALEAGLKLVVYPGDGLPVHDSVRLRRLALERGATLVGPNSPGLISPGLAKLGFMPSYCFRPGRLGVITKSGSLSYEVNWRLTEGGIGQSTVVGVGGDAVKGLTIGEALALFHEDPGTDAMLVLGEIGGVEEYQAADYAGRPGAKPVGAFLVGQTAPPGRKLGHAGALINSDREGYAAKVAGLEAAGVAVARRLSEVVSIARQLAPSLHSADIHSQVQVTGGD